MLLAQDFRRQAHVCMRLADHCDDPRLAERTRPMVELRRRSMHDRRANDSGG
jgi:hypothetical protein